MHDDPKPGPDRDEPGQEPVVEQVRPEVTFTLRMEVLRGGGPLEPWPGDWDPRAGHFAAYADRRVIGVASVLPEVTPDGEDGYRLRGMAVDAPWRGRGVGRALVARVEAHVRGLGGGLLWCQARVAAQAFYAREGFVVVGDVWEHPAHGQHVRMHRPVG